LTDTKNDWTGVEDMQNNDLGLDADECRALAGIQAPQPKPTNDSR
jgi:hypothetical protein